MKKDSRSYQVYQTVRNRVQTVTSSSRVVRLIRRTGTSTYKSGSKTTQRTDTNVNSTTQASDTDNQQSALASSILYRGAKRSNEAIRGSWMYQWLTKEPEPDVIVIDLRETRTVGPVLKYLDQGIEATSRVIAQSTTLKHAKSMQSYFQKRPVRVLSSVLLATVILSTVVLGISGLLTAWHGVIVAGLLLAGLRGTQSKMTLSDIQQTQWYEYLCRGAEVFVPPEPPEKEYTSGDTQREKNKDS